MFVEEVTMRFLSFRAPVSRQRSKPRNRIVPWFLPGLAVFGILTLAGFAQMNQPPSRTPKPVLLPEANHLPDVNDRMKMNEKSVQRHHFDAANAERLKQMTQATDMLETMAIALKAEVDKSGPPSENAIHKAETIEKLAHMVKERMMLSVAAN
jgi:hypothetical protein